VKSGKGEVRVTRCINDVGMWAEHRERLLIKKKPTRFLFIGRSPDLRGTDARARVIRRRSVIARCLAPSMRVLIYTSSEAIFCSCQSARRNGLSLLISHTRDYARLCRSFPRAKILSLACAIARVPFPRFSLSFSLSLSLSLSLKIRAETGKQTSNASRNPLYARNSAYAPYSSNADILSAIPAATVFVSVAHK